MAMHYWNGSSWAIVNNAQFFVFGMVQNGYIQPTLKFIMEVLGRGS